MLESYKLKGRVINREDFIIDRCKNRKVLHIGCADWPFTGTSIKSEDFLHKKLKMVSSELYGIDYSEEGLEIMRQHGFENLVFADIQEKIPLEKKFDVIVFGEVMEHLDNPGLALRNIKSLLEENGVIILTVPNAFSLKSFLRVLIKKELVHPDHLYYYSQATIEHFTYRYGLTIVEKYFYITVSKDKIKRILSYPLNATITRLFPQLSEGLIFVIRTSK